MSCHHEATNDKQRWVKMDRFVSEKPLVIIIITREYRQTLNAKPTRKGWSISTVRTTIELLIFYIDCCRVINISIQGRQLFRAHTLFQSLWSFVENCRSIICLVDSHRPLPRVTPLSALSVILPITSCPATIPLSLRCSLQRVGKHQIKNNKTNYTIDCSSTPNVK